ncbi:MAG: hypothetical protein AAF907_01055 [Planctomycetota bacterium]
MSRRTLSFAGLPPVASLVLCLAPLAGCGGPEPGDSDVLPPEDPAVVGAEGAEEEAGMPEPEPDEQ